MEEFTKAVKDGKKARRNLSRAKHDLEEAVEEAGGTDSEAEQVKFLEGSVAALGAEVRALRSRTKLALSSLARFEPDFPEVMVLLEIALPRELLQVWRPDSALEEMFPARERIQGGRHVVWRCSDGQDGEEFAVKVASPICLCVATPGHTSRFRTHSSGRVVHISVFSACRVWPFDAFPVCINLPEITRYTWWKLWTSESAKSTPQTRSFQS